ncbi:hypothetical protein B0H67DRAFT_491133 [Lasiosphaeris hirsuta]|uniref:Uncharacterized protein n=1 Tax=Lasiosphaeris hirsuta TaxID=260670 RepID=A0AA40DSJ6_9PEZI|nr:hypothetical protein B0H67DRAFT_491133 [Lasiosphaeris hirsuta]
MVILHAFSGRESLGTWDRRLFNALTILSSSLVSLSLGSLLGLLGAVLRWPLLARRSHTPRDVDLILGMPNPTGSLKLIVHACGRNGKWSVTTVIVLAYLVVNIIGRLSVAIFGLTYDLNEKAGVEYPVTLPDFGTRGWMQLDGPDSNLGEVTNFALASLTVRTMYNQSDPSAYNMKNISGLGLDRNVDGDKVTYTYRLREHRGLDEYSSLDRVVQSSSSCLGRNYYNGSDSSPEFLHVLGGIYAYYNPATDYIWAKNWDYAELESLSACATTCKKALLQFERNATFFECTTCLKRRDGNPGLDQGLFFNFPSAKLPYAAGVLLNFGPFDRRYGYSAGQFSAKEYGSQEHSMHFINGLGAMRYAELGESWYSTPVSATYELYAAHLAARLPILAIMGAERQLPLVTREQGASSQPFIVTSLEVKWGRGFGVLGAILVGQLLAVGVVFGYSRRVPVRDHDSFLSVARLLRTAMNTIRGRSADPGKELAESIRGTIGGIRYGTRRGRDPKTGREWREVDLWNDVASVFPKGEKYN